MKCSLENNSHIFISVNLFFIISVCVIHFSLCIIVFRLMEGPETKIDSINYTTALNVPTVTEVHSIIC